MMLKEAFEISPYIEYIKELDDGEYLFVSVNRNHKDSYNWRLERGGRKKVSGMVEKPEYLPVHLFPDDLWIPAMKDKG